LNRRKWLYNKKFSTFFQLQGEPKVQTEDYIEGKFKFFDFEKDWKPRSKDGFQFEYKYLESFE
jgi:CCR4-NOT transcriptional regulation complex NOT5 subunit